MAVDLGGTEWMPVRVCEHLRSNTEGAVAVEINIKISVPLGPTHLSSSFAILESCLVPDASTFAALAKNIAGGTPLQTPPHYAGLCACSAGSWHRLL